MAGSQASLSAKSSANWLSSFLLGVVWWQNHIESFFYHFLTHIGRNSAVLMTKRTLLHSLPIVLNQDEMSAEQICETCRRCWAIEWLFMKQKQKLNTESTIESGLNNIKKIFLIELFVVYLQQYWSSIGDKSCQMSCISLEVSMLQAFCYSFVIFRCVVPTWCPQELSLSN